MSGVVYPFVSLTFQASALRNGAELIETFNRAFEGYVGGDIRLDAVSFAHFLVRQGVDLALSPVAIADGKVRALALMARRGDASRLAAMAVEPAAQGRGVGRALVQHVLDEARGRGDRRVELEVIGDNPAGVRLYRGAGFTTLQRLVSLEADAWSGAEVGPEELAALESVDPYEVARVVATHGEAPLPWQLDAPSLATLGSPVRGVRLGPAWALLSPVARGSVTLLALVVAGPARGRGHGRRLLRAVRARDREARWSVPALFPERMTPFFEGEGFRRGELWQWHMTRALDRNRGATQRAGPARMESR